MAKKPRIQTPELTDLVNKAATFAAEIEEIVWDLDISHLDAIEIYCERTGAEIETVAELIKSNIPLLEIIRLEGEALRMLPQSGSNLSEFV